MGIFDNATSVVINNKEVQSIIDSNGSILYEKPINDILTLTSDKSIIQISDNVDLSATLTNNNIPVSNETVYFFMIEHKVLTLESDKSILSAYDNDTATLTATYTYDDVGVSGKSVVFKNGNTVLDTVITDNNGEAEYIYSSTGAGDVTITAECESLTETYSIEDIDYYNDGTKTTGLINNSNATITTENGAIRITTSTNGEKEVFYPLQLSNSENFSYEIETVSGGNTNPITLIIESGSSSKCWIAYVSLDSKYAGRINNNYVEYIKSFNGGDKLKLTVVNGVTNFYFNDTFVTSQSSNYSSSFKVGHYTNNGRVQYVKNIKIKKL